MTLWTHLETSLAPEPQFYCEAPDDRRDWAEIDRQATFFATLRLRGPRVLAYANANAGKRARHVAGKEGILSGVFDVTCVWRDRAAWIEFKGWSGKKQKRRGALDTPQIEFGNRLVELGQACACFFDPHAAVDWLAEQGFPIARAS